MKGRSPKEGLLSSLLFQCRKPLKVFKQCGAFLGDPDIGDSEIVGHQARFFETEHKPIRPTEGGLQKLLYFGVDFGVGRVILREVFVFRLLYGGPIGVCCFFLEKPQKPFQHRQGGSVGAGAITRLLFQVLKKLFLAVSHWECCHPVGLNCVLEITPAMCYRYDQWAAASRDKRRRRQPGLAARSLLIALAGEVKDVFRGLVV